MALVGVIALAGLVSLAFVTFQAIVGEPISRAAAIVVAATSLATILGVGFVVSVGSSERLGSLIAVIGVVVAATVVIAIVGMLASLPRTAGVLVLVSVSGLVVTAATTTWSVTATGRHASHIEGFPSSGRSLGVPGDTSEHSLEAHLAERSWEETQPGTCADVGQRAAEWWDQDWHQIEDETCRWHARSAFAEAEVDLAPTGALTVSQWSRTADLFVF